MRSAAQHSAQSAAAQSSGPLKRQCGCGTHTPGGGTCAACAGKSAQSLVRNALDGGGQPLEPGLRTAMETQFAHTEARVTRMTTVPSHLGDAGDRREHEADRLAQARTSSPGRRGVDLSGVRIHTGAEAGRSAAALRASAYTAGSDIVFAPGRFAPDTASGRHVLAHEIAHVIQNSRAPREASVLRRFTEYTKHQQSSGASNGWKHPALSNLRVSDDGLMAAEDNDWGPGTSQRAWTTQAKWAESNKILDGVGSEARLRARGGGEEIKGKAPANGSSMTLTEIEPIKKNGDPINLASDCGSACRQIMGSGRTDVAVTKGTGKSDPNGTIGAVIGGFAGGIGLGAAGAGIGYAIGGKQHGGLGLGIGLAAGLIGGAVGGAFAGSAIEKKISAKPQPSEDFTEPHTYHGGRPTTPEEFSGEIYRREFGNNLTREEALARYDALSPAEKDAFDRKYGINKYAVPRVGQGVTIGTEYSMPGYAPVAGAEDSTWNFHYAANVLSSGEDYVTLESAAGWKPDQWIFFMYGPASKTQSFHEEQNRTESHGTKNTSMVVQSN